MANATFTIQQGIFRDPHSSISVMPLDEGKLASSPRILQQFLTTARDGIIGLAPVYGGKCVLTTLALSTLSQCIVVRFSSSSKRKKNSAKSTKRHIAQGRLLLEKDILCHPKRHKYAFRMDKLAASLYLDHNIRITDGVDLLSASEASRQSLEAVTTALGGDSILHKCKVETLFKDEEMIKTSREDVALQAWAACRAASLPSLTIILSQIPRIDTSSREEEVLRFLAETLRDADRLNALKPTQVRNDVNREFKLKSGKLTLTSARFKTRIRYPTQMLKVITTAGGRNESTTAGHTTKVDGRSATISLHGKFSGNKIRSVYTIGKGDPTSAEAQRATIVLEAFQQTNNLVQLPFVRSIWLSHKIPSSPTKMKLPISESPSICFPFRPLNSSQFRAVKAIISTREEDCITIIHGPPGTGKTTVIAASVTSFMACFSYKRNIWLVAQSNVAVKNIAEKLADVGFLGFKLLVSKDFRYDWHEHLYHKIQTNVIQSDDFPDNPVNADRLLLGSRVILCTLSMLSSNRIAEFTRLVPVEVVIVDEASQIEIGDYLPVLYPFQVTLRKLAFIGDDKQLAPYGQDDIGDLRSIFEMPHLRHRAIFLDTQYRMPVPIGNFISEYVYNGELKTEHKIKSLLSCRFVDVRHGREQSFGKSWINRKEAMAAIHFARRFHIAGKSYRIITPYDPQRNMLEKDLKAEKIPWEDKCFNVDSFQGNEEDHIIISVVRSDKIGFLQNIRRTNVMLSRCKKSMVICTNRAFLENIAATSLMGKLATVLGEQAWLNYP